MTAVTTLALAHPQPATTPPPDGTRADTLASPFPSILRVRSVFAQGKVLESTGFVVHPRAIATVGHAVFNQQYGGVVGVSIQDVRRNVLGNGVAVKALERWTRDFDAGFDYAAVLLAAPLGLTPLTLAPSAPSKDAPIAFGGYPLHDPEFCWAHATTLSAMLERELEYGGVSYTGESGGPVWLAASRDVVGIQRHRRDSKSQATRMTGEVRANLLAWANSAQP